MLNESKIEVILTALKLYKSALEATQLIEPTELELESVKGAIGLVKALKSGDAIASLWWIDDVYSLTGDEDYDGEGIPSDITRKQARDTLKAAEDEHNAEIGINWDVLRFHLDRIKEM